MAGRFKRTRRGIEARLSANEVAVLAGLVDEMTGLLADPAATTPTTPVDPLEALVGLSSVARTTPSDPALARLFPDAYQDDQQAADEWRRYTEPELRAGKISAAEQVARDCASLHGGGRLLLDEDRAATWLGALNDLRLAMGSRLGVTEDTYEELDRLDPATSRAQALSVFAWLGWLQETLVEALSG